MFIKPKSRTELTGTLIANSRLALSDKVVLGLKGIFVEMYLSVIKGTLK